MTPRLELSNWWSPGWITGLWEKSLLLFTPNRLHHCSTVSNIHTQNSAKRVPSVCLYSDGPASWHKEINYSAHLGRPLMKAATVTCLLRSPLMRRQRHPAPWDCHWRKRRRYPASLIEAAAMLHLFSPLPTFCDHSCTINFLIQENWLNRVLYPDISKPWTCWVSRSLHLVHPPDGAVYGDRTWMACRFGRYPKKSLTPRMKHFTDLFYPTNKIAIS